MEKGLNGFMKEMMVDRLLAREIEALALQILLINSHNINNDDIS